MGSSTKRRGPQKTGSGEKYSQKSGGIISVKRVKKGGKLISCEFSLKGHLIDEIKITGDFFIHPEESICELERSLGGVNIKDREMMGNIVMNYFRGVESGGISGKDLLEVLVEE